MSYFTLEELTRSDTAMRLGLANTPAPEQVRNLELLISELLDPLRSAWEARCRAEGWGSPAIRITSGFRSPALNRAVGGVPNSAHCSGCAADTVPANGRLREYKAFCREFLSDKSFDQLISEGELPDGTPRWMHIGRCGRDGCRRRELLSMLAGRYLPMTA